MTNESSTMGHDKDKSTSAPPHRVDEPDLFVNPPSLLDDLETFPEPAEDAEEIDSDDTPLAANDGAYAATPADGAPVEQPSAETIDAESTAMTPEMTATSSATLAADATASEIPEASQPTAAPQPEVAPRAEATPQPLADPQPEVALRAEATPQPVADPQPEVALRAEATPQPLADPQPEVAPRSDAAPQPEAPPPPEVAPRHETAPAAEAQAAPANATDTVMPDNMDVMPTQESSAIMQTPVTPTAVPDAAAEKPEMAAVDTGNNAVEITATSTTPEASQRPVHDPAPPPSELTIDASVFDDHPTAKNTGTVPVPRQTAPWATSPPQPAEPTIDASIFDDDLLPPHTTITFPGSAPRYRNDPPPPPENFDAPRETLPKAPAVAPPVGDDVANRAPATVQPPPALVVTDRLTPRPEAAVTADQAADQTPDTYEIADTGATTTDVDKTFFFEDGVRRQRLDLLMHFCMQWHEVLALTSPVNNGKTTFIHYLKKHVADTQSVSIITVTSRMNVDAFIAQAYRAIMPAPGAAADLDRNKMVMRIRDQLQQRYRRSLPPLLILDDAHHLNPELLHALHAMTYLTQPLDALGANLIFVGSEAMLPQVNGIFIQHRVKVLDLPRLTELSARRFILARLTAAGFKNPEMVFTQRQTGKLLRQTQCRIGHLADLIHYKLRGRPEFKISRARTTKAWMSRAIKILLLLPVAGAGMVYQHEIQNFYTTHAERIGTLVYLALPALERSLGLGSETETAAPKNDTAVKADATEDAPSPVKTEETSPFDDETLFVQPTKTDDPSAPSETATEATANADADTPPVAATAITDVAPLNRQHLWLTLQNPAHLTLQIYGTTDETSARQLISQYKLQGKAYYFASRLQGYLWFSVIYGSYADEASAKAHVQEVPETLRSFAKIRNFKDMQALLLEGQTPEPTPAKVTNTVNK